jgi:hypothetical protein
MSAFEYELWAKEDQLRTAISMETGAAQAIVHFQNPAELSDLADFASFLTGSVGNSAVELNGISGKINRNLPLIHPFIPQLSVAGITSIVGASEGGKVSKDALAIIGLDSLVEQVDFYPSYLFAVELQKRKYFIKPDSRIGTTSNTYYPYDGSSGIAYQAANEWQRFTEEAIFPLPDTASATVGTQVLRTHTNQSPGVGQFANSSFLFLQNQRVEIMWYQVPYRYFFSQTIAGITYKPYLTRFVNHVNQYAWNGREPGTLMFMGATPQIYIPQIPDIDDFGEIAEDRLCNVKMTFLETSREVEDPPQTGDTMLTNLNYIPAGHNAFPNFADKNFYYAPTLGPAPSTDQTKWAAPFPSFPFELLFCDPLFVQPGGPI